MRLLLLLDLAVLALLVYCLIDCIQTDSALVRNLSKPVWLLLIVIVPVAGAVAWLVAGRPEPSTTTTSRSTPPRRGGSSAYQPPKTPIGPDDDPEFLRQIEAIDAEHQRTLEQWEKDLRERERRLRGGEPPTDGSPPADGTPPGDGAPPGPASSGGPR